MRMIVIQQATDLQALGTRLLGAKAGAGNGLEALKNLNPHVDFGRLGAGTVLLVPDLPGLRDGETTSIAGQAFVVFNEQVLSDLDDATVRVRAAHAARLADQKDLGALLKGAAQVFKQDPADAKAADETLKALKDLAGIELVALGKLLG